MSGTQSQNGDHPDGARAGGPGEAAGGADPSMEDILASIRRILSEEDGPLPPPRVEAERPPDILVLDPSMLVPDPPPTVPERFPVSRSAPPPPPLLMTEAEMVPETHPASRGPIIETPGSSSNFAARFDDEPAAAEAAAPAQIPPPALVAKTAAPMIADAEPSPPPSSPPNADLPISSPPGFSAAMPEPPVLAVPAAHSAEPPSVQTETTLKSESPPMSASISPGIASPETANAAAGSVTNLVRALTSDRSSQVFSGGPTIADLVREELRPLLKAWLDSNLPPLVERLVRAEIERVISRASI